MLKQLIKTIGILAITALLMVAGNAVPVSADGNVTVTISAPAEEESGSNFTATIAISTVTNINAIQYDILFDPAVLRLDSIDSGLIGSKTLVADYNEMGSGHWRVIQYPIQMTSSVSGSGYLSILHFSVIGNAGASSEISLTNGIISNIEANAVPATWSGTHISVASESTGAPAPPASSPPSTSPPASPPASGTPPVNSSPPESTNSPSMTSSPTPNLSESNEPASEISPEIVDDNGVLTKSVVMQSNDDRVQLMLNQGTISLTQEKTPVAEISISEISPPSTPTTGSSIIGQVYDFGPDGATFEPPIPLTMSYDGIELPPDFNENQLALAFWDDENSQWTSLDSVIDFEAKTVTAAVSHFTVFGILTYSSTPPSAVFTISNLTVSTATPDIDESITVSAVVSNNGMISGSYEATLKINNIIEKTQTVTVAPGETEVILFTLSMKSPGSYIISVGGLDTEIAISPVVKNTPPVPPPAPNKPFNKALIWAIAGGVVFIIVVLLIMRIIRRAYY